MRGGTFSDAWIDFADRSDVGKNCPKKIFRPSSRAGLSRATGPASPRDQLRTARAQIQHLEATLLNLAGTQNAGVARSDAGLRAELRADLDRAVARLATLQGGPATRRAAWRRRPVARRVRRGATHGEVAARAAARVAARAAVRMSAGQAAPPSGAAQSGRTERGGAARSRRSTQPRTRRRRTS